MTIEGKTVLVTGAAKRIGREIARAFAHRGARLLIHYNSSRKEAEALARELDDLSGSRSRLYRADLSNFSEIRRMGKKILKEVGGVDILVNNASIFFPTPFYSTTETEWDRFMAVNLKAPFFLSQNLAPAMKKKGKGRAGVAKIINIADWTGLHPRKDYLPYCVSKGGLILLTEGLAKALSPEVLVTAVCPGPTLPSPGFSRRQRAEIARTTLVGRWGSPEDVAKTVLFLAESDFVTGSCYTVDGGHSIRI